MSRIPTHTLDGAPPASRALLESIVHASPTGHPLNFQAQMGHAPAVLASYVGLRRVGDEFSTLDAKSRAAIMLTAAAALRNDYAQAVTSMLALRLGWDEPQVAALTAGTGTGDDRLDALLDVVREAAADGGRVEDDTWQAALAHGWSDEQLTEAFAPLALIAYTAWFINYAKTDRDLPVKRAPAA
jgi:alkylhydroperoxidase family enzyme